MLPLTLLHVAGIEIEMKETMIGKMNDREAMMMSLIRRQLRKKSVADGARGRNSVAGIAPHCSIPK
jgi:hypothetical protein